MLPFEETRECELVSKNGGGDHELDVMGNDGR